MIRKDREITDQNLIDLIIQSSDVCRLGMYDGDYPYIVVMNYGYKPGTPAFLYFHSAPKGKKIDIIRKNNKVCFEFDIDHELITEGLPCDFSMQYKSVVGYGKIYIVEDEEEKRSGLDIIMKHYTKEKHFKYNETTLKRTTVLKIQIESVTGKQKTSKPISNSENE